MRSSFFAERLDSLGEEEDGSESEDFQMERGTRVPNIHACASKEDLLAPISACIHHGEPQRELLPRGRSNCRLQANMRCPYCHTNLSASTSMSRTLSQADELWSRRPGTQETLPREMVKHKTLSSWRQKFYEDICAKHQVSNSKQDYKFYSPVANKPQQIDMVRDPFYTPLKESEKTNYTKVAPRYPGDEISVSSLKSGGGRQGVEKLSDRESQERFQFLDDIGRLLIKSNTRDLGLDCSGMKQEQLGSEPQVSEIKYCRPLHGSPLISPKMLDVLESKHRARGDGAVGFESINFDITPSMSARNEDLYGKAPLVSAFKVKVEQSQFPKSRRPDLKIKVPSEQNDLYSPEPTRFWTQRGDRGSNPKPRTLSNARVQERKNSCFDSLTAKQANKSSLKKLETAGSCQKKVKFELGGWNTRGVSATWQQRAKLHSSQLVKPNTSHIPPSPGGFYSSRGGAFCTGTPRPTGEWRPSAKTTLPGHLSRVFSRLHTQLQSAVPTQLYTDHRTLPSAERTLPSTTAVSGRNNTFVKNSRSSKLKSLIESLATLKSLSRNATTHKRRH